MFWLIFGVLLGLAVTIPVVIKYWDKIKTWVRAILPGLVSMAKGIFTGNWELVKEGWSYVKRVTVWVVEHGEYVRKIKEEIVPPGEVPQEVKEKLKEKQKISQTLEGAC